MACAGNRGGALPHGRAIDTMAPPAHAGGTDCLLLLTAVCLLLSAFCFLPTALRRQCFSSWSRVRLLIRCGALCRNSVTQQRADSADWLKQARILNKRDARRRELLSSSYQLVGDCALVQLCAQFFISAVKLQNLCDLRLIVLKACRRGRNQEFLNLAIR